MLITNTPICPECRQCVMSRKFSMFDIIFMVISTLVFFPLAIWLYLNPPALYCQGCGYILAEVPRG